MKGVAADVVSDVDIGREVTPGLTSPFGLLSEANGVPCTEVAL